MDSGCGAHALLPTRLSYSAASCALRPTVALPPLGCRLLGGGLGSGVGSCRTTPSSSPNSPIHGCCSSARMVSA